MGFVVQCNFKILIFGRQPLLENLSGTNSFFQDYYLFIKIQKVCKPFRLHIKNIFSLLGPSIQKSFAERAIGASNLFLCLKTLSLTQAHHRQTALTKGGGSWGYREITGVPALHNSHCTVTQKLTPTPMKRKKK